MIEPLLVDGITFKASTSLCRKTTVPREASPARRRKNSYRGRVSPGHFSAFIQLVEDALAGGPPLLPTGWQPKNPLPPGVALAVRSSGSTGLPRVIFLSAKAVKTSAKAVADRLGGTGHWLLALPTNHIAGLNVVARAVLAGAGPTVIDGPLDPVSLVKAVSTMPAGRRYVSLVPTQLDQLLANQAAQQALGSFDAVLLGGAHAPPSLIAQANAIGLNLRLTYGMAETGGGCVYDGRPLDGVQTRLGANQRIELTGPTLAMGYSDPTKTAAAFVEQDGQRWFVSSDQGQLDAAGRLTVLGRLDNVIQSGGLSVAPEVVEGLLADFFGVGQVVVTALPSKRWGQLVFALASGPAKLNLEQLRDQLKDQTEPAQIPRALGWVNQLPVLASGKPDRLAAARLAQELVHQGQAETLD
ncbi:MAG: AMP-binding protein [Micrococcales bacterium]|nr:AMP-binding protein [Micrococcales bacterium]